MPDVDRRLCERLLSSWHEPGLCLIRVHRPMFGGGVARCMRQTHRVQSIDSTGQRCPIGLNRVHERCHRTKSVHWESSNLRGAHRTRCPARLSWSGTATSPVCHADSHRVIQRCPGSPLRFRESETEHPWRRCNRGHRQRFGQASVASIEDRAAEQTSLSFYSQAHRSECTSRCVRHGEDMCIL